MKYLSLLTALFALSTTTLASAAEEALHFLPSSEGIASPSVTTPLLGQNPAGLLLSEQMHVQILGATNNVASQPGDYTIQTYGAFLHFGSGNIAGSVGATKNDFSGAAGIQDPATDIHVGLAFMYEAINTAFGLGGRLFERLDANNSYEGTNDLDLGLLYGIEGPLQVGFTAFNILDNTNAGSEISQTDFGLGLAYSPSEEAIVSLDGRFFTYRNANNNTELRGSYLTPGVKVSMDPFQLSLSYRIYSGDEDDNLDWNQSTTLLAGFGVAITSEVLLQLQYNRIGDYSAGLTARF